MGNEMTVTSSYSSQNASTQTTAFVASLQPALTFGMLTPDVLLEFCESKIRGIDEQVQKGFLKQNERNANVKSLSQLGDALGHYSNGINDGDNRDAARADVVAAYNKAIAEVGPETQLGRDLAAERDKFVANVNDRHGEHDAWVTAGEMRACSETVSRMQQDLNHQGELEMIQLQSLMSQRQQALQMCTNMVQSLNQSSQQIAANVGK